MNYPRLLELFWEFSHAIEDMHALYLDSLSGYSLLHTKLDEQQDKIRNILGDSEVATQEFQDTCSIAYESLCGEEHLLVSMSPVMKQGDLRKRVSKNGKNAKLLGRQIVITAYTYWEEYLRIEIGKAMIILPQDATNDDATKAILNAHVTSDFWGDMRHLRTSIIHKNGIAISEISKCRLLKWFKPGDEIVMTYPMVREIFLCMGRYRNDLHKMSLPLRKGLIITPRVGS